MIRVIEVYDTFEPNRLLELKFGLCNGMNGLYYDGKTGSLGSTQTGRTYRCSYGSIRKHFENGKSNLGVGERVKW
ncbi:MAG: hypothetical protein AABX35_01680 [Nanoarchaeota archaeon]